MSNQQQHHQTKIATDEEFYGIWRGQPGLIIGSGEAHNYLPVNPDVVGFQGRKVGCSEACQYYALDLAIWVDAMIQDWFKSFWQALLGQNCLKMSIACDPPSQYDMHGNDITWLRAQPPERFSPSFDLGFYPADSTGYLAFNVALLLGCNPLWLIGFHSWKHPYFLKTKYFEMASNWLKKHKRQVFVAEENSYFAHSGLFEYKPLPLPEMAETEKEIR